MEWNNGMENGIEHTQLQPIHVYVAHAVYVELPSVSPGLLSHHTSLKYSNANHNASISKHVTVGSSSSDALLLWSCKARPL